MMATRELNRDIASCLKQLPPCCFGRCHRTLASCGKDVSQCATGRKDIVENLWWDLFTHPSQWWDNRAEKVNPRYPDFKHKETQKSLWVDGRLNPSWVAAELAALVPGTLQVDLFTWNRRLARYVKVGQYQKAMELFQQMQREGIQPGKYTFISVLKACSCLRDLDKGRSIHAQIVKGGYDSDVYVGNCLVDMYAKCGSLDDACQVFNSMPARSVVSWNVMILGCVKCGEGKKGLELYRQMQQEAMEPDPVTFVGVLNACSSVAEIEEGRSVHEQIIQCGCESDVFVGSSLVDMYSKCGSVEDAWRVFEKMPTRNVVAWSIMIVGYVRCGDGETALNLYKRMAYEGVEPNCVTFVGVLNACGSVLALEEGRRVHKQIIQSGHESDAFVAGALVDMYGKCARVEDAWKVFEKILAPDLVAWSAMILGYLKCGNGQKALEVYRQMQLEGVEPDATTFVGVLSACACIGALGQGRRIHEQIKRSQCESNIFVASGLIDMYAKCGSIEDASTVFKKVPTPDRVSWTAMLGVYAMHGYATEALGHFERMCQEGAEMDVVTFGSLLSACTHAGLVDEAMGYFGSMRAVYNVSPTAYHDVCMVDLLGRAGRLHEAEDLIKMMSCDPEHNVWKSLLGACRVHRNVEMGELAARKFVELDPE